MCRFQSLQKWNISTVQFWILNQVLDRNLLRKFKLLKFRHETDSLSCFNSGHDENPI